MTDEERTHLVHAMTRQIDDSSAHVSTARDIMAMLLRVVPVALEMLDRTRGDLDTMRGVLGRLAAETPAVAVNDGEDAP